MVCCGQNGIEPIGQNGIMMSHCNCLKKIKMQFVLSSHAYNISLTLFSRCTSLIVIIEKNYLVNNMHDECLFSRLDIILPYPLYMLFQHFKLAGSFIIYFYISINPLLYVFDLIN